MQKILKPDEHKICFPCKYTTLKPVKRDQRKTVIMEGNTITEIPLSQIKTEPEDSIEPESIYIECGSVKTENVEIFKTEVTLTCSICGIDVRDENELQQHSLVHNNQITVPSCVDIGTKDLLQSHACYTCGKEFTCKAALRRHVMIHTG